MKSRGQVNYEGYHARDDHAFAIWECVPPDEQAWWEAGAARVIDHHSEELLTGLAALQAAVSPVMNSAFSALRGMLRSWARVSEEGDPGGTSRDL